MRRPIPAVALTILAALACSAVYGFRQEHLFSQPLWSDQGRAGFLGYTAVFWSVAALLIASVPRWTGQIIAAIALLYTIWWSGLAAPLAVLYMLGAFLLTGRILVRESDALTSTLLGLATWMEAIWIALHFPVNRPAVYVIAFAIPYLIEGRRLRQYLRLPALPDRRSAAALSVLLFVLGAHWLLTLRPEISADALSMHLALPTKVAELARWPFDFQNQIWAVMPNSVDGLYAAAFLLGGETAARLLNFACLALITLLVREGARRWFASPPAMLAAALFASTPVAFFVTSSLFIENVWAVLILGAVLALLRFADSREPRDLILTGTLLGAAVSCKLIAVAFAGPIALLAVFLAVLSSARTRARAAILTGVALFILYATPPYAYAWVKTGNPIFPFSNQTFRSPYFDSTRPFDDVRFHQPLSWNTPYAITFRSPRYMEAENGGVPGFQFFLLLAPSTLLALSRAADRRAKLLVLAAGLLPSLLILSILPNLRYLYAALPIFSIALAWGLGETGPYGTGLCAGLIGLNLWFLPANGSYVRDFALFSKSAVAPYVERLSPARPLIDYLNSTAKGQPVAFFGTDTIAGLRAAAYSANWHSDRYWKLVREAPDASRIVSLLRERGVHHVVAPLTPDLTTSAQRTFFLRWLDPEHGPVGTLALYRLRDSPAGALELSPLPPGSYEERELRIDAVGTWWYDNQFAQASGGGLVYSDVPGDLIRARFEGTTVRYVFTKTFNRGIAELSIDGGLTRLDQYAPATEWQSSAEFTGLGPGVHVLEIRVGKDKNPRSSGLYVDLDRLEIR